MSKLKVLINGRVLTHDNKSGIEEYANNLIPSLLDFPNCEKIEFFLEKPNYKNRLYQHFWEHFILPFKAKNYDILFCPTGLLPIFLAKKTKTIVMIHSLAFKIVPKNYSKIFVWYYNIMTYLTTKKASFILTPSQSEMITIKEYYPWVKNKINFIYHGVSNRFHFNPKNGRENYILFVGSLSKIKNIKLVIEAFWKVREKLDIKLKIVSPTVNVFNLSTEKKRVIEKALQDKDIEFIENISKKDLILLYQKAKLFIFPSLYESFGKPAIEAMLCGTPVITSNKTALPEICKEAAIYIDPNNMEELISAIILVLKNKSLQKKLRNLGFKQATHYKWDLAAKKYVEIFLQIGGLK